ncbi:hypothetical protein C5E45_20090 [Nocardia nova]|uniref:Uncharacterized protein n=1 Tax=Nocardia nova TaxID=37330 RepID=A0A2S6AMC8_9NOCA|nr:hypothetical protein C5E45_20090 [Nocardia nova]
MNQFEGTPFGRVVEIGGLRGDSSGGDHRQMHGDHVLGVDDRQLPGDRGADVFTVRDVAFIAETARRR